MLDAKKRPITLAEVEHKEGEDYYLRINSPAKSMTERSMNRQWRERLENGLYKAKNALTAKGGTKNYEKVIERVGRAIGKYPSVAKYYKIDYIRSEEKPQNMADIKWTISITEEDADQRYGTYFLRTNVSSLDEKSTWEYYNLIREIETSNYEKELVMRS